MKRLAFLALALLSLQACVSVRSSHGYILERDQEALTGEPGFDTKESILAKYGEPSIIGAFNRDAWYYVNYSNQTRAFFKPRTNRRDIVAFHFDEEGKVAEVETLDLADGEEIKMVSRETPTRGRELNFWEQLLGNVGQLPAGIGQEGPTPGQ